MKAMPQPRGKLIRAVERRGGESGRFVVTFEEIVADVDGQLWPDGMMHMITVPRSIEHEFVRVYHDKMERDAIIRQFGLATLGQVT